MILANEAGKIDVVYGGGSRFFPKPYDDLTIIDAMTRLLASDNPRASTL